MSVAALAPITRELTPAPNGCSGACCAAFFIRHTITVLRAGVDPDNGNVLDEAEQIAGMVIPLTPKQARERLEAVGSANAVNVRWADRGHHFTCRHWDASSGRCGIYADRPEMCRGYPYGRGCEHGCPHAGAPIGGDE